MLESIKKLIEEILFEQNLDLSIITCCDGLDVMKIILNEEDKDFIELMLIDENMEYINGSFVVKFVRNLEEKKMLKKIKIISITSFEDQNSLDYLEKSGVDLILTKPFSKNQLLMGLRKLEIIC